MPPLSVMFKTVSSDCNLDCGYCYYRRSAGRGRMKHRIEPNVLEVFMPQYMEYVADSHQANLSWQGGEPVLAGLDFFKYVVSLEAKYARPPMKISNVIQTNATLINEEWAEFFLNYNFLVGVSLDGPETIHNRERRRGDGQGTFRPVMRGIDILRSYKVDFNVLCVIGRHNVRCARELTEFFMAEGLRYLQFMPAMGFQSTAPYLPAFYLVSADEYGQFLVELFDIWYKKGLPEFSVRTFDNLLQSIIGMENDLCIHSRHCDSGQVIEYNGDVYPCDFYIHPDYKLGNVRENTLWEMVESPRLKDFSERKMQLPSQCLGCEWVNLCRGECPRNRLSQPDGSIGASYFCQSYRTFFSHAGNRLNILAKKVQNYRRYLERRKNQKELFKPVTQPDENCPCGSGLKFEVCCGLPELQYCYLFH